MPRSTLPLSPERHAAGRRTDRLATTLLAFTVSLACQAQASGSPSDVSVSEFDTVRVKAKREGTTEGSGSYTSPLVTWGGKAPVRGA